MRNTRLFGSLLGTLGGEGLLPSLRKRDTPSTMVSRRAQVGTIPHRFSSLIEGNSTSDFALSETGGLSDMLTERLQELLASRVSEQAEDILAPSSSTQSLMGDEVFDQAPHLPNTEHAKQPDGFVPYLAKVLSRTGCCSRRESTSIISKGLVTINGTVVTDARFVCSPDDTIHVAGVKGRLRFAPPRLWVYHKPRNVSSSIYDPQGRKVLMAHAASLGFDHLIPVFRLPYSQHGLMLLTNDGTLASYLEHPNTQMQHVYRLRVSPSIDPLLAQRLTEKGITVDGVLHRGYEVAVDPLRSDRFVKVRVRGEQVPIVDILKSLGRKIQRGGRVGLGPFQLQGLGLGQTKEVAVPPAYFKHVGDQWRLFIERDWPFFRRRRIKSLRTLSKYRVLNQKEMEELDSLSSEEIIESKMQTKCTDAQSSPPIRPISEIPLL